MKSTYKNRRVYKNKTKRVDLSPCFSRTRHLSRGGKSKNRIRIKRRTRSRDTRSRDTRSRDTRSRDTRSKRHLLKNAYNHLISDKKILYEPDLWNSDVYVKRGHNCYTYFLNKQDGTTYKLCKDKFDDYNNSIGKHKRRKSHNIQKKKYIRCHKPQPGYRSGHGHFGDYSNYTCENVNKRVLSDNPNIFRTQNHEDKCPSDYYKGSLVVASKPGETGTYHFYRQDDDGTWSHKPGANAVTKLDADDNVIVDPRTANRNYGSGRVNYDIYCHTYCLPRNKKVKGYSALPDL